MDCDQLDEIRDPASIQGGERIDRQASQSPRVRICGSTPALHDQGGHLPKASTLCCTSGMKTSVSLPARIFHAAERHARRTRKSRSQLYAEAIAEYLTRHGPEEVTAAMNRVVDSAPVTWNTEAITATIR